MTVGFSDHDRLRVIKVTASRFDGNFAPRFREATTGAVTDAHDTFVVDLGPVKMIDSTGIGELVNLMKRVGRQRRMMLCGVSPMVLKVFRLTRLDGVFAIEKTVQDCIAAGRGSLRKTG